MAKLTTDEMQQMMVDEMAGRPQSVHGPAADAFLEDFRNDLAEAEEKGIMLEIPGEWPDFENDDELEE